MDDVLNWLPFWLGLQLQQGFPGTTWTGMIPVESFENFTLMQRAGKNEETVFIVIYPIINCIIQPWRDKDC